MAKSEKKFGGLRNLSITLHDFELWRSRKFCSSRFSTWRDVFLCGLVCVFVMGWGLCWINRFHLYKRSQHQRLRFLKAAATKRRKAAAGRVKKSVCEKGIFGGGGKYK